jgi:hypothetical protein
VKAAVALAGAIAVLGGCGAQSHVTRLKALTPSQAKAILESIRPVCDKPGHVLVRSVAPTVHGRGSESWWCVEPAHAYRAVSRGLHCRPQTHLTIDFAHHKASCEHSVRIANAIKLH